MWVTRTMPQPCSSRRLVLTFDRATPRDAAMASAWSGTGDRNRSAWIWATVRLMPHRVPISPQCRMNFSWTGLSLCCFVMSVISVNTEITDNMETVKRRPPQPSPSRRKPPLTFFFAASGFRRKITGMASRTPQTEPASPLTPPIEPMLAKLAEELPEGGGYLYEPKWDGFRALVFRG